MSGPLLQASGIVKTYGHVEALRGANFAAHAGEVTALVGDNGAGKSTLVKCLSGTQLPDRGEIFFADRPVRLDSPDAARRVGIETVFQDLALAPDLDPAANLFLGRELRRSGVLDLVRRVRDEGLGVVFISHSMPHVLEVADRIQVLRRGRRVAV